MTTGMSDLSGSILLSGHAPFVLSIKLPSLSIDHSTMYSSAWPFLDIYGETYLVIFINEWDLSAYAIYIYEDNVWCPKEGICILVYPWLEHTLPMATYVYNLHTD